MKRLTLYSAAGCHLCDDAKTMLAELQRRIDFVLEVVDIAKDQELERRYRAEIPVLEFQGRKIAKFHIDPARVARVLRSNRQG